MVFGLDRNTTLVLNDSYAIFFPKTFWRLSNRGFGKFLVNSTRKASSNVVYDTFLYLIQRRIRPRRLRT